MATSYSDKDLDLVPPLTFSFVEAYVKLNKKSSGEKSMNKGFKYFSEGYIQDLRVRPVDNGSEVMGRCYRSQRKNETPHQIKVTFKEISDATSTSAFCTCPIGLARSCGHIVGLLYQLAKYKILGQRALPEDIAKTSQPQTWHVPRGEKLQGRAVQNIEVGGYANTMDLVSGDVSPHGIKPTLYNPIRGDNVDWEHNMSILQKADSSMLILPALQLPSATMAQTKFGLVPRGSVLSYQQKLESHCIINMYYDTSFPDLPCSNYMINHLQIALTNPQSIKLEGLKMTMGEIKKFEEQTRLQNQSSLWHRIRRNRITASNVGEIYRRRKDPTILVKRLKSVRNITTAAMRQGLATGPEAAKAYAMYKENQINLYPCGVIVNFWCPWLAASPDRKVYNPQNIPPFGLLEIKCPQVESVLEVKYLAKEQNGVMRLKKNHKYYYQILTQLAVTGLQWCDLLIWCQNDQHLETIYFNQAVWQQVKDKVDDFYFNYYL